MKSVLYEPLIMLLSFPENYKSDNAMMHRIG